MKINYIVVPDEQRVTVYAQSSAVAFPAGNSAFSINEQFYDLITNI